MAPVQLMGLGGHPLAAQVPNFGEYLGVGKRAGRRLPEAEDPFGAEHRVGLARPLSSCR